MSSLPEYLKMYISDENKKYHKQILDTSKRYIDKDRTLSEIFEYKQSLNEGYSYYYSNIRPLVNPYIR